MQPVTLAKPGMHKGGGDPNLLRLVKAWISAPGYTLAGRGACPHMLGRNDRQAPGARNVRRL